MPKFTDSASDNPWSFTTRRVVLAGVFSAITIILGLVPFLGFIPLPNLTNGATTETIPTILGGILGGPIVGFVSGLVFGLLSFLRSTSPLFKDPIVAIVPRLFIGITAWATFAALVRVNRTLAAGAAGFVGSATNTILVVGAIIARGYYPAQVIIPVVLPQALAEAIVAPILTIVLTLALYAVEARLVRAPDTKPRDQLPY